MRRHVNQSPGAGFLNMSSVTGVTRCVGSGVVGHGGSLTPQARGPPLEKRTSGNCMGILATVSSSVGSATSPGAYPFSLKSSATRFVFLLVRECPRLSWRHLLPDVVTQFGGGLPGPASLESARW